MRNPFQETREYVERSGSAVRRLRVTHRDVPGQEHSSVPVLYVQASPWGTYLTVEQVDGLIDDLRRWTQAVRQEKYIRDGLDAAIELNEDLTQIRTRTGEELLRRLKRAHRALRRSQRESKGWRLVGFRVQLFSFGSGEEGGPPRPYGYYAIASDRPEHLWLKKTARPVPWSVAKELHAVGLRMAERDGTETFSYRIMSVWRRKKTKEYDFPWNTIGLSDGEAREADRIRSEAEQAKKGKKS